MDDKQFAEVFGSGLAPAPKKSDTGLIGGAIDALQGAGWAGVYDVGDVLRAAGVDTVGGYLAERGKQGIIENRPQNQDMLSAEGVGQVLGQGASIPLAGAALGAFGGPVGAAVGYGGGKLLAGGLSLAQEYAANRMEQEDRGETERGRALAGAIPSAAIEVAFGPEQALAKLGLEFAKRGAKEPLKDAAEAVAKLGWKGALKAAGKTGAVEVGEEFMQMPFGQYGGRGEEGLTKEALVQGLADVAHNAPNVFVGAGLMGGGLAKYQNVGAMRRQDQIKELEAAQERAVAKEDFAQQERIATSLDALRAQAAAEAEGETGDIMNAEVADRYDFEQRLKAITTPPSAQLTPDVEEVDYTVAGDAAPRAAFEAPTQTIQQQLLAEEEGDTLPETPLQALASQITAKPAKKQPKLAPEVVAADEHQADLMDTMITQSIERTNAAAAEENAKEIAANLAPLTPASRVAMFKGYPETLQPLIKKHLEPLLAARRAGKQQEIKNDQPIENAVPDQQVAQGEVRAESEIPAEGQSGVVETAAVPAEEKVIPRITSSKLVKDDAGVASTQVKLDNGRTLNVVKLNSAESMGLPGWHWSDPTDAAKGGFLANTKLEALALLPAATTKGEVNAVQVESPTSVPVRQEAEVSEGIRSGNEVVQEAARPRVEEVAEEKVAPRLEEETRPTAKRSKAELADLWNEGWRTKDTEPTYEQLSQEEKDFWEAYAETGIREGDFDGLVDQHNRKARAARISQRVSKGIKEAKMEAEEAQESDTRYSKASDIEEVNEPRTNGIGKSSVQAVVDALTSFWKGLPKINVVNSESDLTTGQRAMLSREGARRANGWYAHGEVFLLAYNIRSKPEAVAALYHEVLGHHGLQGKFGKELDALTKSIYDGNATVKATVDKMLKQERVKSINEGVEEFLADRAQAGKPTAGFFDRIKALVTKFARQMGLTKAFSDAEIGEVLRQAHDAVVSGNAGTVKKDAVRFQKSPPRPEAEMKPLREGRKAAEEKKASLAGFTEDDVTDITRAGKYAAPNGRMVDILGPQFAKFYEKAETGAKGAWYQAIKQLGPLSAQLNKTYFGKRLKALLNLESSTTQFLRTEFSRKFEQNVLDLLKGDEKLAKSFDTGASALSWSMRQRLNEKGYQDEIREALKDVVRGPMSTLSTDPYRSMSDDTRLIADALAAADAPAVREKLLAIIRKELARQPDFLSKGHITVDYMAEDLDGDTTAPRNSHTYKVFGGLTEDQRATVINAIENAFVEQAKLAVLSAATQTYSARRAIETDILRLSILPFGLNINATQETLGEVMHDYQAMLDTMNKEDQARAARFSSAVMAYMNKGSYEYNEGDAPIPEFDAIKDTLAPLYAAVAKKGETVDFGKNLNDVFNKARTISTETPMIDERLTSTVGGFYIPQQRQSPYRVGLKMYTKDAKGVEHPVAVKKTQYGSFLQSVETEAEMDRFVKEFNAEKQETFLVQDSVGDPVEAYFKAVPNTSIYDSESDTPALFNARQFLTQLEAAGVHLSQKNTAKILKSMSKQHAKTLRSIQASGAYGADTNALKHIGQFMNNAAFRVSDNMFGSDVDALLSRSREWTLSNAQQELDQWKAYRKGMTINADKGWVDAHIEQLEEGVELAKANPNWGRETQTLARDAVTAYRTENSGNVTGLDRVRKWGAVSMLGGNIASAVTNILGGGPAAISALAYKNDKGFGGGHGVGAAAAEMYAGVKDGLKVATTMLGKNGMQALDKQVADMPAGAEKVIWTRMVAELRSGKLQVGQAMSLTQLANEGFSTRNAKIDKGVELYMKPFTASETAIRVATFLAAARLEMRKNLGGRDISEIPQNQLEPFKDKVFTAADSIVEATQGNYETWAKGAALRSGLSGTMLMFMHYPMVQLQLLKNMGNEGRALYLGILFMLAGTDGEPFTDDAKNLYNLLAKMFPTLVSEHDARNAWIKAANAIEASTGISSHLIQKGAISAVTGYDMSALGLSSILRGDKGFSDKAGIIDALGPAASFISSSADAGAELAKAGKAFAGGKTETAKEHLFRAAKASPVKAIKSAAGSLDIADDGRVVTRSGLTVAKDLTATDALARFAGFRTNQESVQYARADIMQQRKEMRMELQNHFNNLFVVAGIENNPALRRETMIALRDMNEGLKGSGIQLTYDEGVIAKGIKEGKKPLAERTAGKMVKSQQAEARQIAKGD